MGLFDWMICEYPLPGCEPGRDWQTKSRKRAGSAGYGAGVEPVGLVASKGGRVTFDKFTGLFDRDDLGQFEDIPEGRRPHKDPLLCAMLILARLTPNVWPMIRSSETGDIWFAHNVRTVARAATETDALDLIHCGVRYAPYSSQLWMPLPTRDTPLPSA